MTASILAPVSCQRTVGLLIALSATAVTLAGIAGLMDSSLLPSLAIAMLLGWLFVRLDYGFTGGFRALLLDGDGKALAASCVIPAVAALVIIPVATLGMSHGRFVAPVGASLLIGAAIFGVGMQISNGCGSGVLVAAGQGSRRMWVALPFFCLGGVLGSLMLPAAMRLPSFGAVDFPALLGPWGGLLATEALLGASALLLLRRARPPVALVRASLTIGLAAAGLFLVSGEPWGITMGLTLWGGAGTAAGGP